MTSTIKIRNKMVRQTSITSYIEELPKLGSKQLLVYNALEELKDATDHEIAKHLGYEDPNKVRPRRFELMEQGLVSEKCRQQCSVTHKQAIVWTITPPNTKPRQESHGLSHIQFRNVKKRIDIANEWQRKHIYLYLLDKIGDG